MNSHCKKNPILSFLLILWLGIFSGPLKASEGSVEVRVDRRVEALAIVQYLADRLDSFESPYQRKVEEHFRPYEGHPAVKLVREMMNIDTVPKGMHSESSTLAMYIHRDLKGADPLNEEDSTAYSRYYGYERIQKLLELLPGFMEASGFDSFRKEMRPYYERWESNMEAFLAKKEWTGPYDELFGVEKDWLLVLNPLKEIQSAHAVRGAPRFNKDTNCFSYSFREKGVEDSVAFLKSESKMRDLFWHEGTHLVVEDGTFVRFRDELMEYAHQFDSCRERIGQTFGYKEWLRYMDECIAYGASLYILKKETPDRFPMQRLLMKYNGFAHTELVLDAFERFDALDHSEEHEAVTDPLYSFLIEELEKVEEGERGLATDIEALKRKGMKMREERKKGKEE